MPDIYVAKRVIDYVGLNARNIPEYTLPLGDKINPVLSLMQAMAADGAKLLSVDANGNLNVSLAGQAAAGSVDIATWAGVALTVATTPNDAHATMQGPGVIDQLELWNGVLWDRFRSASAANLAAQTGLGVALSASPGHFSVVSQPAVSLQASAVKAAGAAGVRHVCTSIEFSAVAAAAPVATVLAVNLRDGASGAGTILKSWLVFIAAAIGQSVPPFGMTGLSLVGTAATAMTLEFSALLANVQQSVSFSGYDAS